MSFTHTRTHRRQHTRLQRVFCVDLSFSELHTLAQFNVLTCVATTCVLSTRSASIATMCVYVCAYVLECFMTRASAPFWVGRSVGRSSATARNFCATNVVKYSRRMSRRKFRRRRCGARAGVLACCVVVERSARMRSQHTHTRVTISDRAANWMRICGGGLVVGWLVSTGVRSRALNELGGCQQRWPRRGRFVCVRVAERACGMCVCVCACEEREYVAGVCATADRLDVKYSNKIWLLVLRLL